MELTAVLTPAEEGGYIALNPETGTILLLYDFFIEEARVTV